MTDIDPDNIATNVEVTLKLPRVITALDYHDFQHIQSILEHDLGLEGVYVTEVGFLAPEYVGLIHTDCESHNQLVMELSEYYRMMEEAE
jgi:hypothetical protein